MEHFRQIMLKPDSKPSRLDVLEPDRPLPFAATGLGPTHSPTRCQSTNRARFGDAKDLHPFTLSRMTLLPFSVLCVSPHEYQIGLSEKIPLNKPGSVERHKCIQKCYLGSCFSCSRHWPTQKHVGIQKANSFAWRWNKF